MTYAGDLSPAQAWQTLQDDPSATLVDVRTEAEWVYVGLPDLSALGRRVVAVQWQRFPDGQPNAAFLDDVRAAGVDPQAPVLFLCRSGARSAAAASAATAAGWPQAHNVSEGFEGDLDAHGHRAVNGWKVAGLPWRQG